MGALHFCTSDFDLSFHPPSYLPVCSALFVAINPLTSAPPIMPSLFPEQGSSIGPGFL